MALEEDEEDEEDQQAQVLSQRLNRGWHSVISKAIFLPLSCGQISCRHSDLYHSMLLRIYLPRKGFFWHKNRYINHRLCSTDMGCRRRPENTARPTLAPWVRPLPHPGPPVPTPAPKGEGSRSLERGGSRGGMSLAGVGLLDISCQQGRNGSGTQPAHSGPAARTNCNPHLTYHQANESSPLQSQSPGWARVRPGSSIELTKPTRGL